MHENTTNLERNGLIGDSRWSQLCNKLHARAQVLQTPCRSSPQCPHPAGRQTMAVRAWVWLQANPRPLGVRSATPWCASGASAAGATAAASTVAGMKVPACATGADPLSSSILLKKFCRSTEVSGEKHPASENPNL